MERVALAVGEAEELIRSYDAMFGSGGAQVTVSAVQAQKTLQSAQKMLEPFLPSTTGGTESGSLVDENQDDEGQKRVKLLLERAYEKEAVLLRQLSKQAEDNRHNRFLFLYQSSVVFEKVLGVNNTNIEALNFLALNSISQACMIKPSPDQDQYFEKAYDAYKKVCDLAEGQADQKEVLLLAIGNWANALEEQAERKKGKEADAIFQRSIDKFKEYVRKSAPRHASKILLGMAVALQARAKNLEADGDAGKAKKIDMYYMAAAENYIDIITHKKAKHNNRYVPEQTLVGAINNYTMVLVNQARLRALYETHFAPFPASCLKLLDQCKKIIRAVLQDQERDERLAEFCDMLNHRMQEVDDFETMITFKSRVAEAQQHTAGM